MTLVELLPMLQRLGFDVRQLPARRGLITLAELEYDEVDAYWHFQFRWDDIEIPVPTSAIPEAQWRQIEKYASAGEERTLLFGYSPSSNWDAGSSVAEIEAGLTIELWRFTEEMLALADTARAISSG